MAVQDKWIQKTTSKPDFQEGSLTRIAKQHGQSAMEFARGHYHAKGKIGEKARFAVNAQKRRKNYGS
jgi:hypothetical protein